MTTLSRTFVLLLTLLALTFSAGATTINVTFTGPQTNDSNGSSYVGPYNLTINGVSTLGTCITDTIDINTNFTWKAVEVSPSFYTGAIYTNLLQAEWLNQRFGVVASSDTADWVGIHQAIWDLFDPGKYTDSTTMTWLNAAQTPSHYNSVSPTSFYVLVPEPNYQLNQGVSQSFLVQGTPTLNQTPEPMTMLLFGSGLMLISLAGRKAVKK
jgi:hypothetical protein